MSDIKHPIVRLKPKANARAIRHGFPWAYDNEIITDRRTRAITPGTIAQLQENEDQILGLAAINPNSKIFARVLERDASQEIDANWLGQKIRHALAMRATLYAQPYYRLVHAEADGLPGLVVDRFGDALVVQPNAAWIDTLLPQLLGVLRQELGVDTIVVNGTGRARKLEGLDEKTELAFGTLDAPLPVPMNGATYMADLLGGQKTGLFFDQRPNHAFAAGLAKSAEMLDVFSHVGGFSLASLAAGGQSALAIDGSAPALELAKAGAEASGVADKFDTRQGDAFAMMELLANEGRTFDLVICDPPAFAPNKKSLDAGLRAYERVARLATALTRPGGYLGVCSCSHAADLAKFRAASARGIGRAGRKGQLIHTGFAGPDHPQLPQLAESGYLKSLFFRLD